MIGKWGRHTRDHRNPENGKKSRRPYAPCRRAARRLHRRRHRCGAGCQTRIIPLSSLLQTSNNIIQKGLAFGREQSGTVTVPNARAFRDPAPPAAWPRWGCGGGGSKTPHQRNGWSLVAFAALAIAGGYAVSGVLGAERAQIAYGKYLVQLGGCTDCHTPGHLLGKPDISRFLGGSDVGLEVPGLGVFVAPNLTPDNVTGLGNWT